MKVLFFTNIPSPYRVDFFNELGKKCDLTVLYERRDADNREASWLNSKTHSNYNAVFLDGWSVGADSAFCPGIVKFWRDSQYDIRIVGDYATPTGILSILYMRSAGIRYGIELDGGYVKEENKLITFVKNYLISKSWFAFSPGRTTDQYLLKYGMNRDNIYFYPFTSLNDDDVVNAKKYLFHKDEYRAKLNITERKVILSVGQMIHRKGFDVLLRAATEIDSDVGIYIIGGKPPKDYLDFVKEKGLKNVHFMDFMEKDNLKYYYAASDMFVLPTREDIWGLVIQEAMSYGLPVITTTKCVAGIELISDKGGELINSDDPAALAKAINNWFSDEKRMSESGIYNLKHIKEYTIERMIDHHIEAFNILREMPKNEN